MNYHSVMERKSGGEVNRPVRPPFSSPIQPLKGSMYISTSETAKPPMRYEISRVSLSADVGSQVRELCQCGVPKSAAWSWWRIRHYRDFVHLPIVSILISTLRMTYPTNLDIGVLEFSINFTEYHSID